MHTFCLIRYSIVFACINGMSFPVKSLSERNSRERYMSAVEKKELIPVLKSLQIAFTTLALESFALAIFCKSFSFCRCNSSPSAYCLISSAFSVLRSLACSICVSSSSSRASIFAISSKTICFSGRLVISMTTGARLFLYNLEFLSYYESHNYFHSYQ